MNMSRIQLPNVTLLGIDCVNIERLIAAMDISEKGIEFGSVKLLSSISSDDERLIKIPHIGSIEDFSKFCIQDLNDYVDTDYVLLVQYDGFVLNPESWTPEFLEYDYIGAPLSGMHWLEKNRNKPDSKFVVGNGGFSLRSKKFLELSQKFANEGRITKFHAEDVALCVWYRDLFEEEGVKYARPELGMKFSVVEDYDWYDKPFGFHGLFNKNIDTLVNRYPDFPLNFFLPRRRVVKFREIKRVFENIALEGYSFNSDNKTDLNVCLVFRDEDIREILEKRAEYYSRAGDIENISESNTDNPMNGIHSSVLYNTKVGLILVNFYICTKSIPLEVTESKELF